MGRGELIRREFDECEMIRVDLTGDRCRMKRGDLKWNE